MDVLSSTLTELPQDNDLGCEEHISGSSKTQFRLERFLRSRSSQHAGVEIRDQSDSARTATSNFE